MKVQLNKAAFKYWCAARGRSQSWLAFHLDIPFGELSRAVSGWQKISLERVKKIALALDVSVDDLLNASGPRSVARAMAGGVA